jgi:hypothetical protein
MLTDCAVNDKFALREIASLQTSEGSRCTLRVHTLH